MTYTTRLVEAFQLAHELHHRQRRKGSEVPYLTHLMAVAALVGEGGGTEDQVIAALLHDAGEDQGGHETVERIRSAFGDTVASYVAGCSDSLAPDKPPWRERKERYIASARAKSPEQKLIIAADKLHNARCILRDLHGIGDALWGRFRGGREGSLWYYAEMVRALSQGWNHPILEELTETVDRIHRKVAHMEEE